jgi:SAM-dependent methyltransferase
MKKIVYHMKRLVLPFAKIFGYHNSSDNSNHWRSRAAHSGSSAVLWNNKYYNNLVREKQIFWFNQYLADLPKNKTVLDFGCGVGYVSKIIVKVNNSIYIDGVDFKEMVSEARIRNHNKQIQYIPLSEWNTLNKKYDFLLSSGTLSAIRDDKIRMKTMEAFCNAAKSGTTVLMIDPFHKWSFLARAKMSRHEVIQFMQQRDFLVVHQSGMLFWPFRLFLSNSKWDEKSIKKWFHLGEKILNILGKKVWSDYKVLVFQKK